MGVEKNLESSFNKNNKNITSEKYRPPALRKIAELTDCEQTNNLPNKITISETFENSNETIKSPTKSSIARLAKRERRPDRAVYIPRARRSEINNPQTITISSTSTAPINNKSNDDKSCNHKRNTIKDNNLPPTLKSSLETDKNLISHLLPATLSNSVITNKNCDKKKIIKEYKNQSEQIDIKEIQEEKLSTILTNSINLNENCDSFEKYNQNFVNRISTNLNTSNKIMNLNNKTNNLTEHNTEYNNSAMRIVDNNRSSRLSKKDHEIDELQRASKEINRSNRRIIKQTFNSDVLEIPEKINLNKIKSDNNDCCLKKVDPEIDDWDTIYDDNGECFDPKIIAELTATVGKVKIETPKADYSAYLLKQAILSEEEFPHVLEISNFPVEFKTPDLMMIFSDYKESGFDIKWVDDTHALAVFSSSRIAAEVLAMGHPFVKLKPLADATIESRTKAKKCSSSLQPYRPRPETCAALARRLVTGALGVRLKTAAEERENEKRVLKEAKERKLLAAKQRDEVWES